MLSTTSKNAVVPFDYHSHQVRTVVIDDQVWFVGHDVCKALDLRNPSASMKTLDADERQTKPKKLLGFGGGQVGTDPTLVNESGLYHLIFRSNKPAAQAFRKWVTSEVLPALRKTGRYEAAAVPAPAAAPAPGVQLAMWEDARPVVPVMPGVLEEARSLMLDVALAASPGSKVARLCRLLKPVVFHKGAVSPQPGLAPGKGGLGQ